MQQTSEVAETIRLENLHIDEMLSELLTEKAQRYVTAQAGDMEHAEGKTTEFPGNSV